MKIIRGKEKAQTDSNFREGKGKGKKKERDRENCCRSHKGEEGRASNNTIVRTGKTKTPGTERRAE